MIKGQNSESINFEIFPTDSLTSSCWSLSEGKEEIVGGEITLHNTSYTTAPSPSMSCSNGGLCGVMWGYSSVASIVDQVTYANIIIFLIETRRRYQPHSTSSHSFHLSIHSTSINLIQYISKHSLHPFHSIYNFLPNYISHSFWFLGIIHVKISSF